MFDHDSKIFGPVHENKHQMDFNAVNVAGHEPNFQERLFWKPWLSFKEPHSGNDHIAIPTNPWHARTLFLFHPLPGRTMFQSRTALILRSGSASIPSPVLKL